ncbi:MAG: UDP-4-amino-4,6-dideoxy-N-acetyl-beta-L-altrosamine transaminase [Vibrionaceae bacterium]
MIPYAKQEITEQDIKEVVAVLNSDFLTQGPKVPEFEQALLAQTGAQFAVAVTNATSALHIACLALGLSAGDLLWTSPLTFVASANCGRYCGAQVDFVDIDLQTYNLCPEKLAQKLALAARNNRLPKVIVAVHFAGQSCDMQAIFALAKQYGVAVIEDASHALGATYQGMPVGNCRYCDICILSFHPVKIITTAEGGAALTDQPHLAQKMALLRSHGITRSPDLFENQSDGEWYYEQQLLGFNYRMTDLQAALGCSQLTRLADFIKRRNTLAQNYHEQLRDLPMHLPQTMAQTQSSWHLYVVRLKLEQLTLSHQEIFAQLRKLGVGVNLHYIPVHLQPYYQSLGFRHGDFLCAEHYYRSAVTLPLFAAMDDGQQQKVIKTLKTVLGAAQ